MLLKVVMGAREWQFVNGNCHYIHFQLFLQRKCSNWPEGGKLDLCDLETGVLIGLHLLEPWDMAAPSFGQIDTQKRIFTPVAIIIEKGIIQSIEPMLDHFAKKFPESKAALDSLLQTKIKDAASNKKRKVSSKSPMSHGASGKDYKSKPKAAKKGKDKKGIKNR